MGGITHKKLPVGAKKNAAHFCAAFGFPVYNLMKSFRMKINYLPLSSVSPPLALIDDTKVQQVAPHVKDKILDLLSKKTVFISGIK